MNFQDVTNLLYTKLATAQGFKTITKKWSDYTSAKNGRPALYFVYKNQTRMNDPSGLPTRIQAFFDVYLCADKKANPKASGDEIILPLRQAVLDTIKPGILDDGRQTLGDPYHIAHVWLDSDEAFYDLSENDDIVEMSMTISVFCNDVDY